MPWVAGRPIGVTIVAVLLGLDGIAALVEAGELALSKTGDWLAIALEALIGAALVYKAFGLESFGHLA
jgi:hypothetical protein